MEKTLVLNATYEPMKVVSWERAIHLYFQNKVDILESYDRMIGSVSISIPVPSVVRIKKYIDFQKTHKIVKFCRKNVFVRDRYQCQYCGYIGRPEELTFDHVVPLSRGGPTTFDNIVTSCIPCNTKKANKMPDQAGMVLARKLHRPSWPLSVMLAVSLFKNRPKVWEPYLFG